MSETYVLGSHTKSLVKSLAGLTGDDDLRLGLVTSDLRLETTVVLPLQALAAQAPPSSYAAAPARRSSQATT